MGFGELETPGIALGGQFVDDGTAGITQAHHLRAFVESLSHRIVDGLAEDLEIQRTVHLDYLRIAAGNQQAEIRERGLAVLLVILLDEIGKYMTLEMIHHDERDVQGHGKRLGEGSPDKQRTQKARPAGKGYGRKVRRLDPGARKCLTHDRNYVQFVGPGCELRHHSSEGAVYILAGDNV